MNKMIRVSLLILAMGLLVRFASAQTGCLDSPENPTAMLALIGAAGSALPWLIGRSARQRKR
jgi:XrtJ-associated TM-motif-TM protein